MRIWIGAIAVVAVLGAGAAGYTAGLDQAPSKKDAAAERLSAADTARNDAFDLTSAQARRRGQAAGLAAGQKEGKGKGEKQGDAAGSEEADQQLAEAAAAAEEQRLAAAAAGGYEGDGGAYDPTPPPTGSYGSFEAFCADQPEETECGGPGDPKGP